MAKDCALKASSALRADTIPVTSSCAAFKAGPSAKAKTPTLKTVFLVESLRPENLSPRPVKYVLNASSLPETSKVLLSESPTLARNVFTAVPAFTILFDIPPDTRGNFSRATVILSTNSLPSTPRARIPSAVVVPNVSCITLARPGMFSLITFKSSVRILPLDMICANWRVTPVRFSAVPPVVAMAFASCTIMPRDFSALYPTPCNRSDACTACGKSRPGASAAFFNAWSSAFASPTLRPAPWKVADIALLSASISPADLIAATPTPKSGSVI